jgi:membrane protein DedA with SNARE-associated domain
MDGSTIIALLYAAAGSPLLQFCAVVAGTFILEDATTVFAAMAVSDHRLSAPVTLAALYFGVAVGDIGLFGLGQLAAGHPWARRFVGLDKVQATRAWLNGRLVAAVISTRFLPGARLPTYTACGFLGVSFRRFAGAVVIGTILWTTLLFTVSLILGGLIMTQLGAWRWPGGVLAALAILAIGHWISVRRASAGDEPEVQG